MRIEHSRERQAAAGVVTKELDRPSQVHLGFGVAFEVREQLSEIPMGAPRVGVGLQAALEPRERRLTVAEMRGDRRAIVVGACERRRQADRLVEQPRRAVEIPIPEVALARDEEELLGALGDFAIAAEANAEIAGARLLVAGRRRRPRTLEDHEAPQTHVPLVRQPLAVPPDAIGRVRLAQRGQAKGFEGLLALGTLARFCLGLTAVVLARLDDGVRARQLARLHEIAFLGEDIELDLHDLLERRMIAEKAGLQVGRRPLEEPAHVRRVEREEPIELGEGSIVLTHAHRERRRAVDQLGIVGRERGGAVVDHPRLLELAHELRHARAQGERAHRRRRRVGASPRQRQRLRVAAGLERRLRAVQIASGRRLALQRGRDRGDAKHQRDRKGESSHGTDGHRTLNGVGPWRASRPNCASRNLRS